MIKTLRQLFLLSRPGMLPLSLSVPILGALALKMTLSLGELLVLTGIGTSAHLFGFILNDLMDYSLDKNHPFRQRSPLVRGEVKLWQTWLFVLIQIPLAYVLYHLILNAPDSGLLWLLSSIILSMIYNIFSKWRWLPRILAEIALAASVTTLAVCGAWAFNTHLPAETWLFCITLGFVLLLVNSVPSGLKDIQFDKLFGARSFVLSTGTTISKDGDLSITRLLQIYSLIVQAIISFFMLMLMNLYPVESMAIALLVMMQLYAALHLRRILSLRHIKPFPATIPFLGGFYNYFSLVLILWAYLPPLLQFIVAIVLLRLLTIPLARARRVWKSRHQYIVERS